MTKKEKQSKAGKTIKATITNLQLTAIQAGQKTVCFCSASHFSQLQFSLLAGRYLIEGVVSVT
jgi:hypothetical protein